MSTGQEFRRSDVYFILLYFFIEPHHVIAMVTVCKVTLSSMKFQLFTDSNHVNECIRQYPHAQGMGCRGRAV